MVRVGVPATAGPAWIARATDRGAPAFATWAMNEGVGSAVSAPAAGEVIATVGPGTTGGTTGGVTGLPGLAGGGVTLTGGFTTAGGRLILNVDGLPAPRFPLASRCVALAV
jgi:hypothetical protein